MISTQITIPKPRKPPKVRIILGPSVNNSSNSDSNKENVEQVDAETQTNDDSQAIIKELKEWIMRLEEDTVASKFCIENVAKNDQLITFYTGFSSYESLKACYDYLRPGVSDLQYWGSNNQDISYGRKRLLSNF